MEDQTTQPLESTKPSKIILNYGLFFGIVSVLMQVVLYVTNSHLSPHWSYMLISTLVTVGFIVYAIKAYKAENGGYLALSEALKVGVGISLIAAIITSVWSLVLMNVLEPTYMEQVAEVQREQMIENYPDMNEEQMNQAMEMGAQFSSPWITIAFGIVISMFVGLIISLIAGAIMKQKRPYEV